MRYLFPLINILVYFIGCGIPASADAKTSPEGKILLAIIFGAVFYGMGQVLIRISGVESYISKKGYKKTVDHGPAITSSMGKFLFHLAVAGFAIWISRL